MKRILVCVGVLSFVAVHSCSGPTEPDHYNFRYPLAVGNQWVYEYHVTAVFDEDSVHERASGHIGAVVSDTAPFIPGRPQFTVTEFFGEYPGDSSLAETQFGDPGGGVYVGLDEGLFFVRDPSLDGWNVVPKPSRHVPGVRLGEWTFSSEADLIRSLVGSISAAPSGVTSDQSVLHMVLPYPITKGAHWTYNESAFDGATVIEKSIAEDTRIVEVNGEEVECIVVSWQYSGSFSEISISDCMSELGLVSREIILEDIEETNYANPYGTGEFYDLHMTYELSDYQLAD